MKGYWNVMATSLGGHRDALLRRLNEFGDFEPSDHPNVVLGRVDDTEDLMERLRENMVADPSLPSSLGRIVPTEIMVPFDAHDPVGSTRTAVQVVSRRIGGNSFHVRVDARGWGRQLHAHDLELKLGEIAWDEISRRGYEPQVRFDDPEYVLMIEIVGAAAGISLVGRNHRLRFPFMKVS